MIYSSEVVSSLVRAVLAVTHWPVVVGIDGRSGSGKSTLARELAVHIPLPVAIVEGDDFYSDIGDEERAALSPADGYDQYFDWRRLKSQVLEPLREGNSALRYQQYDWERATMGNWVETKEPAVVIVEGVYTLRPPLRDLLDVTVYVRTSDELRAQRQVHRAQNSKEWIERWAAAEEYYESQSEPWRDADFTVTGG